MSTGLTTAQRQHSPRERTLEGTTAVVTGSSRGIGRALAESLGAAGATVVVNYRSSAEAATTVAHEIEESGGEAVALQADVGDRPAVDRFATEVREAVGSVDVLVNNAGITADARFEDLTPSQWKRVIDVNLTGVFYVTQAFYEDVREAEHGRIINFSSVVAQEGNIGQANYAAAKSGLFGLTRTLARELAPSGSTANCVAPGFIETDMLAPVPDRVREKLRADIPLDRFGTVEDLTGLVRFLAGPESDYVTGQVFSVNGGMSV